MDLHKIKASSGRALDVLCKPTNLAAYFLPHVLQLILKEIARKEIAASLIGLQDKLNKVWKEAANLVCLHDTP